jgi:hypothetical protein
MMTRRNSMLKWLCCAGLTRERFKGRREKVVEEGREDYMEDKT